jgi:tRNA threonylcarbamoyl adenosine modification protein YjeE
MFPDIIREFLQFGRGVTMPGAVSQLGPQAGPSGNRRSGLKAADMDQIAETFRKEFALPDLDATARLGASIAAGLAAGDAVALWGELGAGKTTLARAILAALGVTEDVPSPTFTLVQSYDTSPPVAHYDLYRLRNARELEELGFEDALADGAVLVEWPERAPEALPPETLHVRLGTGDAGRKARLTGPARWESLIHV